MASFFFFFVVLVLFLPLFLLVLLGDLQLRRFRRAHPLPAAAPPSASASPRDVRVPNDGSVVAPRHRGAHHHTATDGIVLLPDGRWIGYRDHRPVVQHAAVDEAADGAADGAADAAADAAARTAKPARTVKTARTARTARKAHGDVDAADAPTEDEAVLFYLPGLMGSRLEFFGYRTEFAHRHVRIICVDRPGYGLSTYYDRHRIDEFADDLLVLADRLNIRQFSVVGWSSGGCYALACAARIPQDRLLDVGTISCDPPWHVTPWPLFPVHHVLLAAFAWNAPALLVPISALLVRLALPIVAWRDKRLCGRLLEANRFSIRASTKEMILERSPWGFALQDIRRPVHLFHGTLAGDQDSLVPVQAMDFLASKLPQATVHREPGQGHEIASACWGRIVLTLTHRGVL